MLNLFDMRANRFFTVYSSSGNGKPDIFLNGIRSVQHCNSELDKLSCRLYCSRSDIHIILSFGGEILYISDYHPITVCSSIAEALA